MTNKELITAAQVFFSSLPDDEFSKTFTKWQERMDACLAVSGAYFEKDVRLLDMADSE